MHLLLDHDGYLPSFAIITEGKVSDIEVARQFKFDADTIFVGTSANAVKIQIWTALTLRPSSEL